MPAAKFFAYVAELLKLNPPYLTAWSTIAKMKRIGIRAGQSFDLDAADSAVKASLVRVPQDGLQPMKDKIPTLASEPAELVTLASVLPPP